MNNAVVTIKIDPQTKKAAQQTANDLGFSLSAIIKAYLKQLIKTKSVTFSADLEPTPYLKKIMRKAEADLAANRNIQTFNTKKELISHLRSL